MSQRSKYNKVLNRTEMVLELKILSIQYAKLRSAHTRLVAAHDSMAANAGPACNWKQENIKRYWDLDKIRLKLAGEIRKLKDAVIQLSEKIKEYDAK